MFIPQNTLDVVVSSKVATSMLSERSREKDHVNLDCIYTKCPEKTSLQRQRAGKRSLGAGRARAGGH